MGRGLIQPVGAFILSNRRICFWQRDIDITKEVARCPLLTNQIGRLCGFPSQKKAAERLNQHFWAGEIKRVPSYFPARQGKPEFLYFLRVKPQPRTYPHTIAIAEVRVNIAEWQRTVPDLQAEFYYTNEVQVTGPVIPDATVTIRKDARAALAFVEVDLGTEPVFSPNGHYSLTSKLAGYSEYFDSGAYQTDFSWAGKFQGFRVLCIVPASRARLLRQLVEQHNHDFVLITSFELIKEHGLGNPIFYTHDGMLVDIVARRGSGGGFSRGDDREANPRCDDSKSSAGQ
jgi:hypothetical protein